MATQYAGRLVRLKIDLNNVGGGGANWVTLPAEVDGDLDRKAKTVNTNNKADNGWDSSLSVGRSWTLSGSGYTDPADPVYQQLVTDWRNSTRRWIQVNRSAVAGGISEEGTAVVELKETMGNEDVWKYDFTFTGSGSLVVSP